MLKFRFALSTAPAARNGKPKLFCTKVSGFLSHALWFTYGLKLPCLDGGIEGIFRDDSPGLVALMDMMASFLALWQCFEFDGLRDPMIFPLLSSSTLVLS